MHNHPDLGKHNHKFCFCKYARDWYTLFKHDGSVLQHTERLNQQFYSQKSSEA